MRLLVHNGFASCRTAPNRFNARACPYRTFRSVRDRTCGRLDTGRGGHHLSAFDYKTHSVLLFGELSRARLDAVTDVVLNRHPNPSAGIVVGAKEAADRTPSGVALRDVGCVPSAGIVVRTTSDDVDSGANLPRRVVACGDTTRPRRTIVGHIAPLDVTPQDTDVADILRGVPPGGHGRAAARGTSGARMRWL
jgi:hypothetical protein